jgi:hypothetical protein
LAVRCPTFCWPLIPCHRLVNIADDSIVLDFPDESPSPLPDLRRAETMSCLARAIGCSPESILAVASNRMDMLVRRVCGRAAVAVSHCRCRRCPPGALPSLSLLECRICPALHCAVAVAAVKYNRRSLHGRHCCDTAVAVSLSRRRRLHVTRSMRCARTSSSFSRRLTCIPMRD